MTSGSAQHTRGAAQPGHGSGGTVAPRDTEKPGTQAQCSARVDTPRSYSALSNGFCSFCIISIYHCCTQTQVDDLLLAQVWLFCTLIVTATVIPRTCEAPPKVQRLQCFSPTNTFPVHFQTNFLQRLGETAGFLSGAVHAPFLWGWICMRLFGSVLWPRSLLLSEACEMRGTFS